MTLRSFASMEGLDGPAQTVHCTVTYPMIDECHLCLSISNYQDGIILTISFGERW